LIAFLLQLAICKHVADVLGNDRALAAKQLSHLLLREPYRLAIQPHLDTNVSAFVYDDLIAGFHSTGSFKKASSWLSRSGRWPSGPSLLRAQCSSPAAANVPAAA